MPALIVPNAALLRLIWTRGGLDHAVNVFGVHNPNSVAITQAMANALDTAIKGSLTSSGLGALLGTAVTLKSVGIRGINVANLPEFIGTGAATAGTGVGDLLPAQACLCVTQRTALAGRRFRGRVYLSGFIETQNDASGFAVAGALTASKAFVDAVNTALVGQGLALGVVHRPKKNQIPPDVGFVNAVSATVVRTGVWTTQRRRAIGGI